MMTYYVLFVAGLLVTIFIHTELKNQPLKAFFLKGLASFSFLLLFATVVLEKTTILSSPYYVGAIYASNSLIVLLFLLGLICGLLGDLFLALRPLRPIDEDHQIILSGMICFSIGHIFYYLALLVVASFSIWPLLFTTIVSIIIYFGSKYLSFTMKKLLIPSMIYSFLIFLMVGQAFVNAIESGFQAFSGLVFFGAILFAISDLILAPIYFKAEKRPLFIIANLATYYGAQLLLALSLFFII